MKEGSDSLLLVLGLRIDLRSAPLIQSVDSRKYVIQILEHRFSEFPIDVWSHFFETSKQVCVGRSDCGATPQQNHGEMRMPS